MFVDRSSPDRAVEVAAVDLSRVYGLDIETDTAVDGLDPQMAAVIAVAISGEGGEAVFDGEEAELLVALDGHLRRLPRGVLVTWYGSGFDLPFLAERYGRLGLDTGLLTERHGSDDHVTGSWSGHRHLDAYRVYRNDLTRLLDISCSLKSVAGLLGFAPVEVDVERVHELPRRELREYVASDARLARLAALQRWPTAVRFVDQLVA